MKKMLLATARWPCLLQDVLQQTFTVQNKPAAVAPKENHHPSFLRFWNWAEENCRCSQNLYGGAENVVKTEATNIRKWIARFITPEHLYSAGSACVLLTIIA